MPTVSIIMPVYNGERYLGEAVASILGQSFRDFEFIIVDDGSTDGTPACLDRLADPRIVTIRSERNMGIVDALNKGIGAAAGTYLCRMDADDTALPERLQRQVDYLNAHPDIAAVGSAVGLIDPDGAIVGAERYPESPEQIRRTLFIHNPFAHGTVMMRASVIRELGGYDRRFLHNEDYDLWLRLAARHRLANLPDRLVLRRIHPESITVRRETELVRYRIKTIAHAVSGYYRAPLLFVHLVRPVLAYLYRRVKGGIRG